MSEHYFWRDRVSRIIGRQYPHMPLRTKAIECARDKFATKIEMLEQAHGVNAPEFETEAKAALDEFERAIAQ